MSTQAEASSTVNLNTRYNFSSKNIIQPPAQTINVVSTSGATYGSGIYGSSIYGGGSDYQKVNLIGSGTTVSLIQEQITQGPSSLMDFT